jgi:HK97 family phage portal protein
VGLLDRVFARTSPNVLENAQYPLTSADLLSALHIPMTTSSSVVVNERTALGMPAIWRAVNLIAGTAASLPLHAYKETVPADDEESVRIPQESGQAAALLAKPHPDLTAYEFWELIYAHMLLWGNAYAQILRDQNGVIRELWPVHPSQVRVGRAKDLTKVYQLGQDMERGYTDREILHFPAFGYDGVVGLSPIACARQGIGLALAAEEFGARLFGSGTMAGGILTTDQRLNQAQADALKVRWQSKIGGLQNSHEVAVLDAGAKFQQLTIPPQDAQFIQSRGFQIEEVARIYGVPPHMLMSVDKTTSWGAGIEQQTIAFVTYTLRPWLTRVEQRVSAVLQPGTVYARYNLAGLVRGDLTTRYQSYALGRQWGWLSVDDIRRLEEMPPLPGGDGQQYITPLNMEKVGGPSTTAPEEPSNAA